MCAMKGGYILWSASRVSKIGALSPPNASLINMSPKIDDSRIQHFGGKVLQSGLPNLAGTVLIKTETRAGEMLKERLAVRRLTDFMSGS